MSAVSFHALIARSGSKDGARASFEQMLAQLVRIAQPGVRRIQPNPGDWGIDTFLGRLDDLVSVWQAKFFIDGVGDVQKGEIRESLASLMRNATEQGFTVDLWTLCIPCSMDPAATKWWDGWKRRMERELGIKIELWDETELVRLLIAPESDQVLQLYFGICVNQSKQSPIPIFCVPDDVDLDDMLFIEQLLAAKIPELDSAKEQFFNHDLVSREIADKGVSQEINAIQSSRSEARSLWETRYNSRCEQYPKDDQLPGLHGDVMKAIESLHNARHPSPLALSLIHKLGAMHQVVEDGKAGWVRDFRRIAQDHEHKS